VTRWASGKQASSRAKRIYAVEELRFPSSSVDSSEIDGGAVGAAIAFTQECRVWRSVQGHKAEISRSCWNGKGHVPSRHMHIEVHADSAGLARAAAIRIAEWIRVDGHRTVGLAGGSTPRLTYEFLGSKDVPWEQTHLWLTDERHVPMDHPESNGGMVLESLLSHVPARFHAVDYHEDAAVAAAGYERTLHEMWRSVDNQQQLGLMLLGVGDDGHTASLFPGTAALKERDRDYVANWVNDKCAWRLTATPSLLAQADQLVFLVAGEAKAPVVKEILEQDSNHPAAIVSRAADDPVWMLDRAAASCLTGQRQPTE